MTHSGSSEQDSYLIESIRPNTSPYTRRKNEGVRSEPPTSAVNPPPSSRIAVEKC